MHPSEKDRPMFDVWSEIVDAACGPAPTRISRCMPTFLTCRMHSNGDTRLLRLHLAESHRCIMIMSLLLIVVM